MKVLVASPVRDRDWVLPEFLECLKALDTSDLEVEYFFLVNDSSDGSMKTVWDTVIGPDPEKPLWSNAVVGEWEAGVPKDQRLGYLRESGGIYTHMRAVRDKIRQQALKVKADYLFSVDSDILVRPNTLQVLLAHKLDFVAALVSNMTSSLFNGPNAIKENNSTPGPYRNPPQWVMFQPTGRGLVEVAVTGACFLVSKKVLKDCTYLCEVPKKYASRIKTLPGEDEYFAVDCAEKGFKQYLDESHRVFHVYYPAKLIWYTEAKEKYKGKAVEVLVERLWAETPKSPLTVEIPEADIQAVVLKPVKKRK